MAKDVKHKEVVLLFLPEEADTFIRAIGRVAGELGRRPPTFAARYADYDCFFRAMVKLRNVKGITNEALAVRYMVQAALEKLEKEASGG